MILFATLSSTQYRVAVASGFTVMVSACDIASCRA